MLEVKNLSKTYKPKKGQSVAALNDVSLSFPSKGMVFLLGKSGSGKSTLLNILGGLDGYTSGEIIIKGKSSKDFSPNDFDSYRNTYVGFIFQEFNLLEDYSVGENISLAQELRQEKRDRALIERVMQSVDLDINLYDRKVTELSGGQKQRVSIARALIKNPEIIMADEPTGSLDSVTGKQIFDTLKKLSEDKLVIVVSHDKDSAKLYGDRVIELADGKVISDTESATEKDANDAQAKSSDEFRAIKSRLPIKASIKMGFAGLIIKKLRLAFIIFLSFLAFTMFGLSTVIASFDVYETSFQTAKANGEKTLLVSSRVDNTAIGTSFDTGVGHSFAGISQSSISEIERLTGNKVLNVYTYQNCEAYSFLGSLGDVPSSPYYATSLSRFVEVTNPSDANLISAAEGSRLPQAGNYKEIAISDWVADSFVRYGLIIDDTVTEISKYEDLLGKKIILADGSPFDASFFDFEVKITGVYKTDINKENYASFKDKKESQLSDAQKKLLSGRGKLILSMGFVAQGFSIYGGNIREASVFFGLMQGGGFKLDNKGGIDWSKPLDLFDTEIDIVFDAGKNINNVEDGEVIIGYGALDSKYTTRSQVESHFYGLSEEGKTVKLFQYGKLTSSYKVVGVYLNFGVVNKYGGYDYDGYFTRADFEKLKVYANGPDFILDTYSGAERDFGLSAGEKNVFYSLPSVAKASAYDFASMNIYWGKNGTPKTMLADNEVIIHQSLFGNFLTVQQYRDKFDAMNKTLKFGSLRIQSNETVAVINGMEAKVVGIYLDDEFGYTFIPPKALLGDGLFNHAVELASRPNNVLVRLTDNWGTNRKVFSYLEGQGIKTKSTYDSLKPYTSVTLVIESFTAYSTLIKNVFLGLALGFCVFAGLLLANFIAVSIANKKKEIGILRAIGARSFDVFKIFFSEGLIIGLFNFIISFIAVAVISAILNGVFGLIILVPSVLTALYMLLLSLGIVFVSTIMPIYKIAKKKPIDAINGR